MELIPEEPDFRSCDACQIHKATYGNRALLGSEARICPKCFEDWYENGITDPEKMRHNREKEIEKAKELLKSTNN